MSRHIIIIAVTMIVAASFLGCVSSQGTKSKSKKAASISGSSQGMEFESKNTANINKQKRTLIGMPDPSAVYCVKLGYKYKIVTDDEGNQRGICCFPDGTECGAWAFYRGKSGQEWSYCKINGYDLKELGRYEGWDKGAVCIDKVTKKEIGTVFDLFVKTYLSQSLPENTRR
jgi:putative hemolysin